MFPLIRLAKQIAVSNMTELKAPYRLTYALTYRCQLKCGMCNIWKKKPLRELDAAEIGEFFRRFPHFSWINLSGGEIFLRPDLPEIIAAITGACKRLYLLNFPTNGYETERIVGMVREIVRSRTVPKLLVTVSLDGTPPLHDRIRNAPGSWDRAIETYRGLRQLKGRGFGVFFGMTLQNANADAFEETLRAAAERVPGLRAADFHVNVVHASGHYYENTGCDSDLDRQGLLGRMRQIGKLRQTSLLNPVDFLERRYQRIAAGYLGGDPVPVTCQALGASLFMDPAGTVYPCTVFDRPLGNIREAGYDLRRLWNGEERRSLRHEIVQGLCPRCWTPCEAYQSILADLLPGFKR
jgi:MoaA/NifB/PqqE/SkfB family radical SAM enzyme